MSVRLYSNISKHVPEEKILWYYDIVQDRKFNDKNKYLIENSDFASLMLEIIYLDYMDISESFRFFEWNCINGKKDYATRQPILNQLIYWVNNN